jgi:hypothetical protein
LTPERNGQDRSRGSPRGPRGWVHRREDHVHVERERLRKGFGWFPIVVSAAVVGKTFVP